MQVGTVESLWRYPVKSMRGEELPELFVGIRRRLRRPGLCFPQHRPAEKDCPTSPPASSAACLLFDRVFVIRKKPPRHPISRTPKSSVGVTPVYADRMDLTLDVDTPAGRTLAIDDPALLEMLRDGIDAPPQLTLLRSDRALTDAARSRSFPLQSIDQLAAETGLAVDKRRFRANLFLDLTNSEGFAEDGFVGRSLRVGEKATLAIVAPRFALHDHHARSGDRRENARRAQDRGATARGPRPAFTRVVLAEGMIRRGDAVELLD